MKTNENWLDFLEVALAAPLFTAHSLYQGWYSWRQTGDVAPNFMTAMGGRDRLDRSVHFAGGPTLLARPIYVASSVPQHR
jgi:hypothetical protein